jgi:hypothetical protein
MKIVIAMITINRAEFVDDKTRTGKNYINQTMESFERSGLWDSRTPFEFHLYDGGSKDFSFIDPKWLSLFKVIHTVPNRILPRENAGRALIDAVEYTNDYVIFVEDDIAVCKGFLDSAARFIERYMTEDYRVVSFYTPYREVAQAAKQNYSFWQYPVVCFYGTQALAIRACDAFSAGTHIANDTEYSPQSYDLALKRWHTNNYPHLENFLSTVPSYVQHTGEDSALNPGRFHACDSFLGEQWSAPL